MVSALEYWLALGGNNRSPTITGSLQQSWNRWEVGGRWSAAGGSDVFTITAQRLPAPPVECPQERHWWSSEVMQLWIPPPSPSLSTLCLGLSPHIPPSSHIPRMLNSSWDKVSTAEVTTHYNRYPSPPPPSPPNDAIPASPPSPVYNVVVCLRDARQHKHD